MLISGQPDDSVGAPRPTRPTHRAQLLLALISVAAVAVAVDRPWQRSSADAQPVVEAAFVAAPVADATTQDDDLAGTDPALSIGCTMTVRSISFGASGDSVVCLQKALAATGYLDLAPDGAFGPATLAAVQSLQADAGLLVDGIVGEATAQTLGIWTDESALVVRTPKPAEGAMDLMGYRLSSVASAGKHAPPLPDGSGSGRRLVYDRAGQRVWAVGDNGEIIRSWLVSGSIYANEVPGTYSVYSRSETSTAWNGQAYLPLMVRYLKTQRGNIGFHSIPLHIDDGSAYQTEDELGTRLSGGCQRQARLDAEFVWAFADIGTKVVVV
ncbi:MAG: L,D-transpeptidase family protein [Ilumatobacteraceae bacterium]